MTKRSTGKNKFTFRYITQKNLDDCLADIARGSPVKHAAESNNFSEGTFYEMINNGLRDFVNGVTRVHSTRGFFGEPVEFLFLKEAYWFSLYQNC